MNLRVNFNGRLVKMLSRSGLFYFLSILIIASCSLACQDLEIVTRAGWNARIPEEKVLIHSPVPHIIICHTVTPECDSKDTCSARMRSMQNYHIGKGYGDIGYNFVIGGDGRVYEGAGWSRVGAHTYGWNTKSHGIAFIGNFMNVRPNDKMLRAARKLIICGIRLGFIPEDRLLHGARDAVCTLSPGDVLYKIIKEWPRFQGGPLPGYRC